MKSESIFSKMHTSGLIVEHRHISVALSADLAYHISHRRHQGTVAVVTSSPRALMSSVRKQWLRLIRLAQRERASTLNRQRKDSLDEIIRDMQAISFTAKDPAIVIYLHTCRLRRLSSSLLRHLCAPRYISSGQSRSHSCICSRVGCGQVDWL